MAVQGVRVALIRRGRDPEPGGNEPPARPGGEGRAEPDGGVAPVAGETIVPKQTNSAFIGTDLERRLRESGFDTLVVTGVSTNNSVEATVRMAGNLGFEVYLVEAGQLAHCGARPKTDVLDAQWIQRLHTYGLLRPSFRPPDWIMALRGYHRQRQIVRVHGL